LKEIDAQAKERCAVEMESVGTERTETKVAEEDQNRNKKSVERIGHVKKHYMP
jgi:hypothetical protein